MDKDKQACRIVAKRGYLAGMWPESYIMWDFLKQHPKAMEPEYLHLNWNHIPGMYCRKNYLPSLVIKQEEWDHLSDPAYLVCYWEPTHEKGNFHRTFTLVLCWSRYSDCEDESRREEYIVSVAVIWKLACFAWIPFAAVADEFSDPTEKNPTLLIVRLHHSHFTMMHYNVGHPQKYV